MATRFDWHQFLIRHHISFVVSGPNVAKNNVAIKCPWCGSADQSEHLGISLDVNNPVWGCFRNAAHRGRSPVRLISKLLRISYNAATLFVEQSAPLIDDFDAAVDRLRSGYVTQSNKKSSRNVAVEYPKTFRRLLDGSYGKRFIDYLAYRGFHAPKDVAEQYDLRYCLVGDYAWRLIFPVMDGNSLIGWTGRDIRDGARLRYRASDALGKDVLLSFGGALSKIVVVVEGPLDALKVDYYGKTFGVRGIATMGAAVTDRQRTFLSSLVRRVPVFILFDSDAISQSLSLASEVGARWLALPSGIKDPGEMSSKVITMFLSNLVK